MLCARPAILWLWVGLTLSTTLAIAQTSGSISGDVVDEVGKSKSGAWITAIRNSLPPARGTVAADSKGAFVLPNLPPGDYRVCAQSADGGYLDTCLWSGPAISPASLVTVIAGQTTSGTHLNLRDASALQVRIEDPLALLGPAHPEREVVIGVFTPLGTFDKARVKSADNSGRTHQVWIPFDAATRLHVSSAQVTLADDKGNAIADVVNISVTRSKNANAASPIMFRVTGLKRP